MKNMQMVIYFHKVILERHEIYPVKYILSVI